MSDLTTTTTEQAVSNNPPVRQTVLELEKLAEQAPALKEDILFIIKSYAEEIKLLDFSKDDQLVTAMAATKELITSVASLPPSLRAVRRGVQHTNRLINNSSK